MIRLIRFNLFSFASRLTTYIIPLITLVVVALTALVFTILPGANFINKSLTLPILFFFSMVFLIQSTIIFFRLPQEETLLPIMMTKPYSRRKLYFSHLLSNELVITLFSIYIALLFTTIGAIDGNVSGKDLGLFFASALIGNIIIMTIFASLISLTCLVMSASWNTLIWMMIVFIIPVSSAIGRIALNQKFTAAENFSYSIAGTNGDLTSQDAEQIYLDLRHNPRDQQSVSWNKSQDNPYSTFAWFDPWYQLSDIYSVFRNHEVDWSMSKWEESSTSLDNAYTITLNGHDYKALARNTSTPEYIKTLEFIKNSDIFKNELQNLDWTSWTFERQVYFFNNVIEEGIESATDLSKIQDNYDQASPSPKTHQLTSTSTVISSIDNTSLEAYIYFVNEGLITPSTTTDAQWTSAGDGNFIWVNQAAGDKTQAGVMLVDETNIKTFTPHDFIDTKWILVIWSSIFVITLVGGILIYTRKEIINI